MKRLLLAVVLGSLSISGCKKDDDGVDYNDINAKIYITGEERSNKSLNEALSVHEIIMMDSVIMRFDISEDVAAGKRFSFADGNIDTENDRFVMEVGNLQTLEDNPFLTSANVYFVYDTHAISDTIAYVLNIQRKEAFQRIKEIWNDDTRKDEMFEIFTNAFTFIPCTGSEFKEMKKNGTN